MHVPALSGCVWPPTSSLGTVTGRERSVTSLLLLRLGLYSCVCSLRLIYPFNGSMVCHVGLQWVPLQSRGLVPYFSQPV